MRRVAGNAAFSFYRSMFPRERPCLVCMTVKADHVLGGGGTQLVGQESTVLVVAVGAVDQAFIHPMVEGLGKIRLDFQVAAITERRLGGFQKLPVDLG